MKLNSHKMIRSERDVESIHSLPFEYDSTPLKENEGYFYTRGMEMQTMTEMLIEWHTRANVPILDKPQFPENKRVALRCDLISEECIELGQAIEQRDIVEVADALADLLYVTIGTALEFGIPIDKVFAEVHRSNMTKCVDGKIIYREDGKVLKPKSYEPPKLREILFPERNK